MGLEVRTFALFISLLIDCYFRSHKFFFLSGNFLVIIFFGVFIRILFRSIEAAFLAGEPEIQLNSSNRSVTLNLVNR